MKPAIQPAAARYRVGDLDVDMVARTVSRDGELLPVKGLSFELLACLIRHHPELASTRDIDREVWGENVVSGSARTQRVKLLREALAGSNRYPDYLESVKSRGYRLVVPVTPGDSPAARRNLKRTFILAGMLTGFIVVAAVWIAWRSDRHADPRALFVLPFETSAGDFEWAEGIRQEVVDQLNAVSDLPVVVTARLPPAAPPGSIVLEGDLQETAAGVELRTLLRELGSGKILWERRAPRAGPGQAPREATRTVAAGVAGAVTGVARPDATESQPTVPPEAYELYLRARYHGAQYARSDLRRGIRMLDRALEIAPDFAPGYSLRAGIYSLAGTPSYGWMTPQEAFDLARRDALLALSLDPNLAGPSVTIGNVLLWHDWNPAAAELAYRRALEVNPDSRAAWLSIALLYTVVGRHEDSLAAIDRALEIAPLDAGVHANSGWRLLGAHRFEEALAAGRRAAALDPTLTDAYNIQLWALVFMGRLDDALEVPGEYTSDSAEAYVLAKLGRPDQARNIYQALLEASTESYVPPSAFATVLIGLEDYEGALDWLATVVEQRSREALFFRSSAIYEPLADHPRFHELLRRVGIWETMSDA